MIEMTVKPRRVRAPRETAYDQGDHLRVRAPKRPWTKLREELMRRYGVHTWVELGCGLGVDVATSLMAGMDAYGIDDFEPDAATLQFPRERYLRASITDEITLVGVDGIGCREVAEHIPFEHSLQLVRNVVRNCRVCYWAAAPPNHPAHGHINCRFPEFWLSLFREHGWVIDPMLTMMVAQEAPLRDDREHGYVLCGVR